MPAKKPSKQPAKKPAKVGLPTQLAAIQARYRRAMLDVHRRPEHEHAALIRAAIRTMLAEKAALGIRDGEEAASPE
ncbi:hypothetical protein Q8W71_13090 [Methylobacterium sp. NEAU 140]|uniref:hypothetical protein n=1 Tax=Methylobacterium sp. NEAU 140 TaxID=3064945 RepID=UPI00273682FF|nr:hypothetical protein [Methylobacterium sp. NEAU 140]MDP4023567.1 hypothetical protein [Methylobacterium sp. NEAU 140]